MITVFYAKRFTSGNAFFPLAFYFLGDRVTLVKPGLLHTTSQTLPLSRVVSVDVETGPVTGTLRIESFGGGEEIVAKGFGLEDLEAMRGLVEGAMRT